ncbi:hypothetical protein [Hydrogenophaga sp.]|uniref:hypothetical protein n=1 Tax=Hydrogenophaga sp. TaxID=1904254 RepID=UPI00286D94E1|nr:hypothetical protein [Hydrogenophaga sp.]
MTRLYLISAMMAAFTTGCAVLPEHELASVSCSIKQVALSVPDVFSASPGECTIAGNESIRCLSQADHDIDIRLGLVDLEDGRLLTISSAPRRSVALEIRMSADEQLFVKIPRKRAARVGELALSGLFAKQSF